MAISTYKKCHRCGIRRCIGKNIKRKERKKTKKVDIDYK